MFNEVSAETHMARSINGQTFLLLLTLPFFYGCTVRLQSPPKTTDAASGKQAYGTQRDLNLTNDIDDSGVGLDDNASDAQPSDVSADQSSPADMDPLQNSDSTTQVTDPELSIESSDGGLVDAELSEVGTLDLLDHGVNDAVLAPDQNSSTDGCELGNECLGNCLSPSPDPCAEVICGLGYCRDGACICPHGHGGDACSECENGWRPDVQNQCRPMVENLFDDEPNTFVGGANQVDDYVEGRGGNDILRCGQGNDFCDGGDGDDQLYGASGSDILLGGRGTDALYGANGADHLNGGEGDDHIEGGDGHDYYVGSLGNDTMSDSDGNDVYLLNGAGDDVIDDRSGNDEARCGPGVLLSAERVDGNDRILEFATGGRVTIVNDSIETIWCCY